MYNVVVTAIYGDPDNIDDCELDTLLEDNYFSRQDAIDAVNDTLYANDIDNVMAEDAFDQIEEDCTSSNKVIPFDIIDGELRINITYTRDV